MAESSLEKLKRLAAEKKAAGTVATPAVTEEVAVAVVEEVSEEPANIAVAIPNTEENLALRMELAEEAIKAPAPSSITTSDHPLAMQFAELEQALNAKDPQFPTILRQIHRHLGQDAALVTQMTEEEIQLIVTGMVVYAQAEIVEPAKAKTAKAAVAKAKKAVITADDL